MPRPDERPDDGLIHAWLDGELSAEEAARVERLVAEDAEWAAAAAEARGLMAASTRILGALDVVAGDVIPRGGSAAGTFAPTNDGSRVPTPHVARWAVPTWMRVAAGAALVAGVGYLGLDRMEFAGTPSGDAVETSAKRTEDATAPSAAEAASPSAAVGAIGAPDDRARQRDAAARNESDLAASSARRDASFAALAAAPAAPSVTPSVTPSATASSPALSAIPAPAPAPAAAGAVAQRLSTSQDVAAAEGARVTTGVAGGVASGTVPLPSAELKEVLPAASAATEREARAKAMQRGVNSTPNAPVDRLLDSPRATETGGALAARAAESSAATANVSGCWRARTTARVDSIQTSLRIIRVDGDTLVLALTPVGAQARVVRLSVDLLRGQARDALGDFVDFSATRANCAP